ncbi:hypothetical protein OQA88_7709 [Cercophora sp. LCS_1]
MGGVDEAILNNWTEADSAEIISQFYRSRSHNIVKVVQEILNSDHKAHLGFLHGENYCIINTEAHQPIGVLNQKASEAFGALLALGSFHLQGSMNRSSLQRGLSELENGVRSPRFEIDVIVLGPVNLSEEVSRILSKYRLFLQHPDSSYEPHRYMNPQYLVVTSSSADKEREVWATMAGSADDPVVEAPSTQPTNLLTLFDLFSDNRGLLRAREDACIKTSLKE